MGTLRSFAGSLGICGRVSSPRNGQHSNLCSGSVSPQLVSCWSQKDSLCTLSPQLAFSRGRKAWTHLFTPRQFSECQSCEPREQGVGRGGLSPGAPRVFVSPVLPGSDHRSWAWASGPRALSGPQGGKWLCQLPFLDLGEAPDLAFALNLRAACSTKVQELVLNGRMYSTISPEFLEEIL